MSQGRASSGCAEIASAWPLTATAAASAQTARPTSVMTLIPRRARIRGNQLRVFNQVTREDRVARVLRVDHLATVGIAALNLRQALVVVGHAVFDQEGDALVRRNKRQRQSQARVAHVD